MAERELGSIHAAVERYYTDKFISFGETPQGVDWNSSAAQTRRFEALSKVFERTEIAGRTLLDFGCGYGAFYDFLRDRKLELFYTGFDLSEEMIEAAKKRRAGEWLSKLGSDRQFDFIVASGVFNVRGTVGVPAWWSYVITELSSLYQRCSAALAVNFIPAPDAGYSECDHLFYLDTERFIDWSRENLSPDIETVTGYGIHDVTFLIRRM